MSTAMQITDLLAFGVKNKASDLHISAGLPPMIRVNGDIRRINLPEMNADEVGTMISSIMNDLQRKNYQQNLETDFSFELPNIARRVAYHSQQSFNLGRAQSPAHFPKNRRQPTRFGVGNRANRFGQIHHPCRHDGLCERKIFRPHPHH